MSDCCSPGGHCSHNMDTKMTEEISARFEELAALEHEFEDVEEEISKSESHYYYYYYYYTKQACLFLFRFFNHIAQHVCSKIFP